MKASKSSYWGVGLALLALMLAACAPLLPGQGEAPTLAPTEAPATEIPAPTATPEREASPTAVGVTTPTPAPEALVQAWTSTSPDGQWTATLFTANLFEGESYYVRLRVEGSAGAQVWVPVDEWRPMGLGFTLPGLVQWSADGQKLYFTDVPHPDGCSLYVNGGDLSVLDLATGQVTELMPEQALWVALSPDETRLAYIGYGRRGLVIRDLASGQEEQVNVPRPAAPDGPLGAIVWAPDGNALALTASFDPCGIDGRRSIVRVDLVAGESMVLVGEDARGLETKAWTEAGQITLVDANGAEWWLDAANGSISPVTATGPANTLWTSTSPDGQWTAVLEQAETGDGTAPYRVRLTLARADGAQSWIVANRAQPAGLGGTTPAELRWSADGARFYYTEMPAVDGCVWFANGSGLYSVELASGRVTTHLPQSGLALALAPDEARVAYVGYGDRGLIVRDLVTTAELPVPIAGGPDALTITELVWSPDSKHLAVTLVADACVQLEPSRYLTMIVDAETGAARTLLDNDPRLLTIVEWAEAGRVKLQDWDGGLWWLDVDRGEVVAVS